MPEIQFDIYELNLLAATARALNFQIDSTLETIELKIYIFRRMQVSGDLRT